MRVNREAPPSERAMKVIGWLLFVHGAVYAPEKRVYRKPYVFRDESLHFEQYFPRHVELKKYCYFFVGPRGGTHYGPYSRTWFCVNSLHHIFFKEFDEWKERNPERYSQFIYEWC